MLWEIAAPQLGALLKRDVELLKVELWRPNSFQGLAWPGPLIPVRNLSHTSATTNSAMPSPL